MAYRSRQQSAQPGRSARARSESRTRSGTPPAPRPPGQSLRKWPSIFSVENAVCKESHGRQWGPIEWSLRRGAGRGARARSMGGRGGGLVAAVQQPPAVQHAKRAQPFSPPPPAPLRPSILPPRGSREAPLCLTLLPRQAGAEGRASVSSHRTVEVLRPHISLKRGVERCNKGGVLKRECAVVGRPPVSSHRTVTVLRPVSTSVGWVGRGSFASAWPSHENTCF